MDTNANWRANFDWDALRREWEEWGQRKPIMRAPRAWTHAESGRLFGTELDDMGNYSAGLFTTSPDTEPPSSPDTLLPNVRKWLSTEPPALPDYVQHRLWVGDEPPPGPPWWVRPLEAHHVDDYMGPHEGGATLLWFVVYGDFDGVSKETLLALAGELLERGANPNAHTGGDILMQACERSSPVLPMVKLLCDYGADASVKNSGGHTALSHVLQTHMCHLKWRNGTPSARFNRDTYEVVRALLRNGALLDGCYKEASAEDLLQEKEDHGYQLAKIPEFVAIKRLFVGIRAAGGSYDRYTKKELLVLRALVRKRRATTADDNQRTAFDILARSPDEIAWRILGFRRW